MSNVSFATQMAAMPAEQRERALKTLSKEQAVLLLQDWRFWARKDQLAPEGDWRIWWLRGGRGSGKTRSGAEWVIQGARSGQYGRFHLVGRTAAAVRGEMLEGPSGILTVSPNDFRPQHRPSKRELVWPNGAVAITFSADEPDALRGPQCEAMWGDELGAWRYQKQAWDMAMLGLRLGDNPRCVVTSTPQVTPIIKELIDRVGRDVVITRASTYDNRAHLAEGFFSDIVSRYEGTRLGRQELYADLLEDSPGALWKREDIEKNRVTSLPESGFFAVVVGVDPGGSSEDGAAETGIVAGGATRNGHIYVLDDRSLRASPKSWATEAVACLNVHQGDTIAAEKNFGGEMVLHTIRTVDQDVPVKLVHASRGKEIRAEPISSRYEQGRVHHVGAFPVLEDQQCQWEPNSGMPSPDRVDSLVWMCTELMNRMRGSSASVNSGSSRRAPNPARQVSVRSRVANYGN